MLRCNLQDTWKDALLLVAHGLQPLLENYFRNQVYDVDEYHWAQCTLHLICDAIRAMDVPEYQFVVQCYKARIRAELQVCSTFRDLDAHTFLLNAYAAIAAGRGHQVRRPAGQPVPSRARCRCGCSSSRRPSICSYY